LSPLTISGIAFACILGGTLLGMLIRRFLPAHHLDPESKDVVKLGLTLIGTLTALVLGLLVASAKGTYDSQNNGVKDLAAKIIVLDRALSLYGSETKEARDLLRRAVDLLLARLWPEDHTQPADLTPGEARAIMETFYGKVASLSPQDDPRKAALKSKSLDFTADLTQTRLRLFASRGSSIPRPLLVVLVVWLTVLFTGYGLLAPRNPTVIAVLSVCILSVAGALFLIQELDRPFEGLLRVSSAPIRDARAQIGE
jgi:hypothetical protein